MGGTPDFTDKIVLDVGCGHGGLCVDMALAGAKKVVGLDIFKRVIDFSKENVETFFPDIRSKTLFYCMDLSEYDPNARFDIITSKNAFEHIQDVPKMLEEMKKRLAPGGRIYIGFGPLYNSMNGSHMVHFIIPWGHLFIPMPLYLKITEWDRGHPMKSVDDFGLNRNSYKDYLRFFKESGMDIVYLKTNQSKNKIIKIFKYFAAIPFLREFFTSNMYCILEKRNQSR